MGGPGPLRSAAAAMLLALVLSATVSLARVASSSGRSVGDECRLPAGCVGECRLITNCPSAITAIRLAQGGHSSILPNRCGFKGHEEIVCCEKNIISGSQRQQTPGGRRHKSRRKYPGKVQTRPRFPGVGDRPRFPGVGDRPRFPGVGERPQQDSEWAFGAKRRGRPSGSIKRAQRVGKRADAACRVYSSKCPHNVNPFIVDGTAAYLGEIPHMAALGYNSNNSGEHMIKWDCGGTLISDRYVMTAAHCTKMVDGPPVVVRLGDLDLVSDDEGATPTDFTIEKIEMHPSYSSKTSYHDIALLRLGRSVNFTDFICPACLYLGGDSGASSGDKFDVSNRMAEESEDDPFGNYDDDSTSDYELSDRMLGDEAVGPGLNDEDLHAKILFASGWGATSFAYGDRSPVLMLAKMQEFSYNECDTSLHEANGRSISLIPRGLKPNLQLCAGDRNGTKDTCLGDSGGPLQYKENGLSNLLTVVGITSFGLKCGFGLPGVYTRVSSYVDWIEQKVWPQGPPS